MREWLIPPQLFAGGAAVAVLAGFLGGWTVRDWKADADQIASVEKAAKWADEARAQGLAQGTAFAQFQAGNQQQAAADRQTIRETYREIRVPADCAVPAPAAGVLEDGVRRANAAAAGEPRPALPKPAGPAAAAD